MALEHEVRNRAGDVLGEFVDVLVDDHHAAADQVLDLRRRRGEVDRLKPQNLGYGCRRHGIDHRRTNPRVHGVENQKARLDFFVHEDVAVHQRVGPVQREPTQPHRLHRHVLEALEQRRVPAHRHVEEIDEALRLMDSGLQRAQPPLIRRLVPADPDAPPDGLADPLHRERNGPQQAMAPHSGNESARQWAPSRPQLARHRHNLALHQPARRRMAARAVTNEARRSIAACARRGSLLGKVSRTAIEQGPLRSAVEFRIFAGPAFESDVR